LHFETFSLARSERSIATNAENGAETGLNSFRILGSFLALMWDNRRNILNTRRVTVSIALALLVAVVTESVLLLGYVIAGSTLLLGVGMLLRRALHRVSGSRVRWSRTRWEGVNDRTAA
jgi:predicted branched-subunit amino acid permease